MSHGFLRKHHLPVDAQPTVPADGPASRGFAHSAPLNLCVLPRSARENPGAELVPLFSATLRENQGHETDRSAAAQPRD